MGGWQARGGRREEGLARYVCSELRGRTGRSIFTCVQGNRCSVAIRAHIDRVNRAPISYRASDSYIHSLCRFSMARSTLNRLSSATPYPLSTAPLDPPASPSPLPSTLSTDARAQTQMRSLSLQPFAPSDR